MYDFVEFVRFGWRMINPDDIDRVLWIIVLEII